MFDGTYDFDHVWLARQIRYKICACISTRLTPDKQVVVQLKVWNAIDGEQKKSLIKIAKEQGVKLETRL